MKMLAPAAAAWTAGHVALGEYTLTTSLVYLRGLGGRGVCVGPVGRRHALRRTDDDDDLRLCRGSGSAMNRHTESAGGCQQSDREREGELSHCEVSLMAGGEPSRFAASPGIRALRAL